ncbi:MAG: phosphatidylinositol-specific phospholipase C domain-containing protein [Bacteroidia bacterium]|nr:phosphatidylinositol-specific phospholipase C domain-containing protein [Bacteroidia bacterium]
MKVNLKRRNWNLRLAPGIILLLLACSKSPAQCNGSSLLCNKRYDQVAYLTTHNAFNSAEDNFALPNQTYNIATQLQDGVRALMIDVYDVSGVPTCYHGYAWLGSAPLLDYLGDIKTFLDDHPNEVVTIIFECYVSANAIESVVNQAGLMPYLYTHSPQSAWPTLQTMISDDTRLVIFSDKNDASSSQGWYHYVWDYAVETHFSVSNVNAFTCDYNRGNATNDLFILNHFVTTSLGTGSTTEASVANANPFFINRILQCQQEKNKFPNFPTVDFYELGNALDAVNQLNGVASVARQNSLPNPNLQLYPNPACDRLILSGSWLTTSGLSLFNTLGQEVTTRIRILNPTQVETELDISALEPGIYLLKAAAGSGKFLKVK